MSEEQSIKQAYLVIHCSVNGRDGWHPVKDDELPAWVKEPDVMCRLVRGECAMKCDEGEVGSMWYRAEKVEWPVLQ